MCLNVLVKQKRKLDLWRMQSRTGLNVTALHVKYPFTPLERFRTAEEHLNRFAAWCGLSKHNASCAHLHAPQGARHLFYATRKTRPRVHGVRGALIYGLSKSSPILFFPPSEAMERFVDPGEQNLIWCCQNRAERLRGIFVSCWGALRSHEQGFLKPPKGRHCVEGKVFIAKVWTEKHTAVSNMQAYCGLYIDARSTVNQEGRYLRVHTVKGGESKRDAVKPDGWSESVSPLWLTCLTTCCRQDTFQMITQHPIKQAYFFSFSQKTFPTLRVEGALVSSLPRKSDAAAL